MALQHFAMLACATFSLAAYGGSGSGGGVPTEDPTVDFENILPANAALRGDERVTLPDNPIYNLIDGGVAGVSILEGVGVASTQDGGTSPDETRYYLHGTRDAGTGQVTISDTRFTLTDDDITDRAIGDFAPLETNPGIRGIILRQSAFFVVPDPDKETEFVLVFETSETDAEGLGGIKREGVFGVTTRPDDVPDSGSAAFEGVGFLTTDLGASAGTVQVTADFANGLVNSTYNATTTLDVIDRVSAIGMEISGNSFTGGSIALSKNGADVIDTALGSVNGHDAAGLFFGPAVDGTPEEIGGYIQIDGADSKATVIYTAK